MRCTQQEERMPETQRAWEESAPRLSRRRLLGAAAAAALPLLVAPGRASAQPGFPSKPVHLVVPFAAGGATDVLARLLATSMEASFGQPVIVANRVGAAGG